MNIVDLQIGWPSWLERTADGAGLVLRDDTELQMVRHDLAVVTSQLMRDAALVILAVHPQDAVVAAPNETPSISK